MIFSGEKSSYMAILRFENQFRANVWQSIRKLHGAKGFAASVLLLTIKISQSTRANLAGYCKNMYRFLLSNCISYRTESERNEYKYPTIVDYCTVPCERSSCYTCSFLSSYCKSLKTVKLNNKSLIRCFGMKYHRIVLLVVCILTRPAGSSEYSTTRKNIPRYNTRKHLIRSIC